VLLVAHRTPADKTACARLAAAGAQVFEVDVQIGAGEQIIVSHYLPLGVSDRLQRDNWRLRWHTAAMRDPRLLDIAAVVPADCLVLLDLKERVPERRARLVAAIAATLPDRARYRVCGPRPADLDPLRDAGFATWRTVGYAHELDGVFAAGGLADEAVTIRHSLLTPDVIDRLHALVPTVVAWTVNDPRRARELRDLGVAGVTTDRVAVLRALTAAPH
jgi:glycerophosphoryl diester phosphodiesterase